MTSTSPVSKPCQAGCSASVCVSTLKPICCSRHCATATFASAPTHWLIIILTAPLSPLPVQVGAAAAWLPAGAVLGWLLLAPPPVAVEAAGAVVAPDLFAHPLTTQPTTALPA